MTDFVSWQFMQLLSSLCCGMILGFLFSLYSLFRYFCLSGRRILSLADVLWWIFAFVGVFLIWFLLTEGDLQFHYVLWQVIGFVFYWFFLARFVTRGGKRLVNDAFEMKASSRPGKLSRFFPWLFMAVAIALFSVVRFFRQILQASGTLLGFLAFQISRGIRKVFSFGKKKHE